MDGIRITVVVQEGSNQFEATRFIFGAPCEMAEQPSTVMQQVSDAVASMLPQAFDDAGYPI